MVDVTSVKALYHELPRETEVLTYFYRFFIYYLRAKVLRNAAIVYVTKFVFVVLVIKEIINVYIVDIALDSLQINIIFAAAVSTFFATRSLGSLFIIFSGFLLFRFTLDFVCFFQPIVRQYLRNI